MFGSSEVRTHLGVVFSDTFGLFEGFWLDFWKNGLNQQNLGNFGGPTPRYRDPKQQCRSMPKRGMSTPRRG